jgi:hypothetical protein
MCPYTVNLNLGIYNLEILYYWDLSANVYQILTNWGKIVLNPRYDLLLPSKQSAVPNQWSECSGSHFSVAIRVRLPHRICGIVSKEKKPISPPKTLNATVGPSFSVHVLTKNVQAKLIIARRHVTRHGSKPFKSSNNLGLEWIAWIAWRSKIIELNLLGLVPEDLKGLNC